jgi:hypothetical protein
MHQIIAYDNTSEGSQNSVSFVHKTNRAKSMPNYTAILGKGGYAVGGWRSAALEVGGQGRLIRELGN